MNKTAERLSQDLKALGIWPPSEDPTRQALFVAVVSGSDLSAVEFQTIRDVCDLGRIPLGEGRTALEAAMMNLFLIRRDCCPSMSLSPGEALDKIPAFIGREGLERRFLEGLRKGEYAGAIGGIAPTQYLPLIEGNGRLAFHRYHQAEDRLQSALRERRAAPDLLLPGLPATPEDWNGVVKAVLNNAPRFGPNQCLELDVWQKAAVAQALLRSFVIITGGPGTGKTSVVFTILRCFLRGGLKAPRIALAAPTGRAAQRLGESLCTQLEALLDPTPEEALIGLLVPRTLHRLLGYSPAKPGFYHNRENQLEADLILIDESSMVDTELMSRLLDATSNHTRLVLIGDKNQLPSIEVGTVLADLVGELQREKLKMETATDINRILEGSGIPKVKGNTPPHHATVAPTLSHTTIVSTTTTTTTTTAATATVPEEVPTMFERLSVLLKCHRSNLAIINAAKAVNGYQPDRQVLEEPWSKVEKDLLEKFPLAPGGAVHRQEIVWKISDFREEIRAWTSEFAGSHSEFGESFPLVIGKCMEEGLPLSGEPLDKKHALSRAFGFLTRHKILTVFREGTFGVEGINRLVAAEVKGLLPGKDWGDFFPGAVVMVTRNDYRLELFNGDTGLLLPAKDGHLFGVFPRLGAILRVPLDELPGPELAFAVTVHKSQGSEFDEVLLVLSPPTSDTAARLLTREIVYTGLTRAKERVRLLASAGTLLQACARRTNKAIFQ